MEDTKTITITVEEYNLLLEKQKQVDELKERVRELITDCDNCPLPKQAVKDTAKEIFAEIGELCDELFNGKILTQEFMAKYAELMKHKGVEVE